MVYKEQSSDGKGLRLEAKAIKELRSGGYAAKCWFSDCNETKTKYCPMCDKWLCDSCRKNYWKRIKGFLGVTR